MKVFLFIISVFSIAYMSNGWASSDYTNVAGWQNCTKAVSLASYKFFCLPKDRPANCPEASWNSLTKGQLLPFCPLCPPKK